MRWTDAGSKQSESDAVEYQGGCNCGAVRFLARAAPLFVTRCHCTACRKATSAAFSTWVGFASDDLAWTAGAPARYESSNGVRRGFCSACGTPLSYEGAKWPGETHLLIGSFDRPGQFVPTGDVFTDEALAWVKSKIAT